MSTDTPAAPTTPAPTQSETPEPVQLPDDHPLVKTLAEQKKLIKELKPKATRLDELEEAQRTDAEKAADRIAKAEAEVATIPTKVAEALRGHLVTLHEIDKDKAELYLTATDPDLLLKQVDGLLELSGKQAAKKAAHVPGEGTEPKPGKDPVRDFARDLFDRGNAD